jgi:hypothetical protein
MNLVYKYQWDGDTLSPTLIQDLPAGPGPDYNGGKLIRPDGYLYEVIGDKNMMVSSKNFADGSSSLKIHLQTVTTMH